MPFISRTIPKVPNVNVAAVCDIDERLFPKALAGIEAAGGKRPKTYTDIRRLLEDKDIDAISIAVPNHWHALATIWACQAGKDVYVEKPACYAIEEGRRMVQAASKHQRVVQVGTHHRSRPGHAISGGVSALGEARKDLHDQMCLLSASRRHRPQARLCRRRRTCTTTCFADPHPWLRSTRTAFTTTGIGSGTRETARPATTAHTWSTWPVTSSRSANTPNAS